jgi:gliding motility-associated-like protein
VHIPTGFTPNGDGNNDFFPSGEWRDGKYIPPGYGITGYTMIIADRWGHLIYETDPAGTPWNGRMRNTGDLVKSGVYIYKIDLTYGVRDFQTVTGYITVIR